MFHMMNEARVAVGAGAVALGYTGYLKSLDYARTRTQGRPPGGEGPEPRRRCRWWSTPTCAGCCSRRRRSSKAGSGSSCTAASCSTRSAPAETPEARAHAHLLLEVLTPIAKSWPSQYCLQANDLAIQVHGGYGYTREYDVEQHYRDNRLNPIHEGTHGIQALDLLGRKVVMADGAGLAALADAVRRDGRRGARGRRRSGGPGRRSSTTRSPGSSTPRPRSTPPTSTPRRGWPTRRSTWRRPGTWWSRGSGSGSSSPPAIAKTPFHQGKRQAARYFYRFELPQTGPKFDLLARLDPTTVETDPGWL